MSAAASEINENFHAISETKKWFSEVEKNANGREAIEKIFTGKYVPSTLLIQKKKIDKIKFEIPSDNPEIPGASSAIQICYSEQYGRHLVATRDIRPGEIILIQKMYCAVLPSKGWHRYCDNCLKQTLSGIPCDFCPNVIYCSEDCRSKSWSDHHDIECQVVSALTAMQISLVPVRITVKALKEAGSFSGLQELIKKLDSVQDGRTKGFTGNLFDSTKYTAVCTAARSSGMYENAGEFKNAVEATFVTYMLATRSNMFGKKLPGSLHMFEENSQVAFITGISIRHVEIANAIIQNYILPDEVTGIEGISPILGLFNHSCDPSVESRFNTATTTFTVKSIKKGEMICDCYGRMNYLLVPKAQRQSKLQAQWHFKCTCVACEENWPVIYYIPRLQDIDASKVDREKAALINEAIDKYVEKVDGRDVKGLLEPQDYMELHELIINIIDLICNNVYVPTQERLHFQEMLLRSYASIVHYL